MQQPASISDNGNTKLGPLISAWSIPAGIKWSCPGESKLCRDRCYAKRGFYNMNNVSESLRRNFAFSQTADFTDWMVLQLTARMARVVRIHVSGDFYSAEYADKWQTITSRLPRCHFFAYTRSWRDEAIFPSLVRLGQEPNVSLWWSIDRETGPAPTIRGIRRAYMAIDDTDASLAPDDCDLVFRDEGRTIMKRANGVQVCPYENGVKTQVKMTCSRCGICWRDKLPRWEHARGPAPDVAEISSPGNELGIVAPEKLITL